MHIYKSLIWFSLGICFSSWTFANAHDVQIYARGYNYVVIASPSHNVEFLSQRASQRRLSPNILLENDVSAEQIPIKYILDDVEYNFSLLVSPNISSPYISMFVEKREALPIGERVTVFIDTNVPERAIGDYTAMLNGREVLVKKNRIVFDAYSQHSKLEVKAQLLSDNYLTTSKILDHEIIPQYGCDVVFEQPTLYAVCFSNTGSVKFSQFYLDGIAIGNEYGEFVAGDSVPNDLKLEILVDNDIHVFNIEQSPSGFVSIPLG